MSICSASTFGRAKDVALKAKDVRAIAAQPRAAGEALDRDLHDGNYGLTI